MDPSSDRQKNKSQPANFKQNESYKNYRERLLKWTIKNPDETLLKYFEKYVEKPLSYYISEGNLHMVGETLINLRQQLLDQKFFFKEVTHDDFAISKTITLPKYAMSGYGDDLIFLIGNIMGCGSPDITSGKKELPVFAGHRNHVHIAYKTYNYLNAFLQEKYDGLLTNLHKNTKQKNRYTKAGWHCSDLLYNKMLNRILDDELTYKLFSDENDSKLYALVRSKVGLYYDENMPIGGWAFC